MTTPAVVPPKPKIQKPTQSPLEAGDVICGACGKQMTRHVIMGPRAVERIDFHCVNEETGCNYRIERRVPVQNYEGPKAITEVKR